MKKILLFFLLFMFVSFTYGQVANKEKVKPVLQKDTLKKDNSIPVFAEMNSDTLIVLNGKYKLYKQQANASYYADKFVGKKTASGAKYSHNKYTAAHRKLPFGTILKITNETTGKYVIVEVNDRGPFSKGREIDLSKKAYMALAANKNSGVMKVKIEILEP